MAKAVTELTGVDINRDHKPGGSGTVGMTAYMASPADGYNVLEHIDDASSAYWTHPNQIRERPNPAGYFTSDLSQIYIRSNETRYNDWKSFVAWVKKQIGKATIATSLKKGQWNAFP